MVLSKDRGGATNAAEHGGMGRGRKCGVVASAVVARVGSGDRYAQAAKRQEPTPIELAARGMLSVSGGCGVSCKRKIGGLI